MEFTCQTIYDQQTLTVMARTVRKTVRKAAARRARGLAGGSILLFLVLLCASLDTPCVWVGYALAIAALLLLIWKEDACSAFLSRKCAFPGSEPVHTVFHAD